MPDWDARRQRAHEVRAQVIDHLDAYLDQFSARLAENGVIVQRAADAGEANRIVLGLLSRIQQEKNSAEGLLVAKSKSMVSEEIGLNHALEASGHRVVETDLGEYIIQLRGERPAHIITPAVHLNRGQVGELFHEKLGIPYTEDIPVLTNTARAVLREVFLTADVGMSGVNFGVIENGALTIVTNEGNGRMCTSMPRLHIALMGIERLAAHTGRPGDVPFAPAAFRHRSKAERLYPTPARPATRSGTSRHPGGQRAEPPAQLPAARIAATASAAARA